MMGAKNAFGFDLSAACSGFLYALTTGAARGFRRLHGWRWWAWTS